jgi:hypothetical protein
MRRIATLGLAVSLTLLCFGTTVEGQGRGNRGKRGGGASYFHEHGYAQLHIPPGHYPAPGQCRIWFPGRPPGHQPPPGNCSHVPPGAWVIRHPADNPGYAHVIVHDERHRDDVRVVGEFKIVDGVFVRVVWSR